MKRILRIATRWFFLLLALGAFYLLGPTNEIDNALGLHRGTMIKCTLEWGRLAPFPKTAQDFDIWTDGTMFTRTFLGSFSDTPAAIDEWLKQSPGVQEGQSEIMSDQSVRYVLKTGEGAAYGEVIVTPNHSHIYLKVYWS